MFEMAAKILVMFVYGDLLSEANRLVMARCRRDGVNETILHLEYSLLRMNDSRVRRDKVSGMTHPCMREHVCYADVINAS